MSGIRTTGRIKKPKAVFDPSDNYLPRKLVTGTNNAPKSTASSPTAGMPPSKRLSQSSQSSSASSLALTEAGISPNAPSCYICLKKEINKKSLKTKFVSCLDCGRKVHKLCLNIEFEDLDNLQSYFKCNQCSVCVVCDSFDDDAKDEKELLTCCKCVKSYHPNCHIPNVLKFQQPNMSWKCNKCSISNKATKESATLPVKTIREIIGDEPKLPTQKPVASIANEQNVVAKPVEKPAIVAAKPLNNEQLPKIEAVQSINIKSKLTETIANNNNNNCDQSAAKKAKLEVSNVKTNTAASSTVVATNAVRHNPNEMLDIPDVKHWNMPQVYKFFLKYAPNEAYVFKEHEIDGQSLLLMKRSDIIKKLSLKLGPSLRLYKLILKIQTKSNDPTLGWNCAQ